MYIYIYIHMYTYIHYIYIMYIYIYIYIQNIVCIYIYTLGIYHNIYKYICIYIYIHNIIYRLYTLCIYHIYIYKYKYIIYIYIYIYIDSFTRHPIWPRLNARACDIVDLPRLHRCIGCIDALCLSKKTMGKPCENHGKTTSYWCCWKISCGWTAFLTYFDMLM